MTNIFFDTEFTGLHKNTSLISIGLVSDTGEDFYAELTDYNVSQIDNWLKENVIKNLSYSDRTHFISKKGLNTRMKCNSSILKYELINWFNKFDKIEIWSDCLSYDWVLFNNIFGTAFDIPKNIYYIPFDICTLLKIKNINPDESRELLIYDKLNIEIKKHNALFDANVIKLIYEKFI